MIDGCHVARHALWVTGAAIVAASASHYAWLAGTVGRQHADAEIGRWMTVWLALGLGATMLGWTLVQSAPLWHGLGRLVVWVVLVGFAWRRWWAAGERV